MFFSTSDAIIGWLLAVLLKEIKCGKDKGKKNMIDEGTKEIICSRVSTRPLLLYRYNELTIVR
jgi:hypothetical protein